MAVAKKVTELDLQRVAHLARDLTRTETRRRMLRLVASGALAAALAAHGSEPGTSAKRRSNKRRKKRRKNRRIEPTGSCALAQPSPEPPCPVCQTCDAQSGQCVPQPDGFGCFLANGGACGDRYSCQNGACVPAPLVCPPPEQCQDPGVCGPPGGALCVYPNKADGSPCNDGNVCTTNDVCTDGVCAGTPSANGTVCGNQSRPGGGTTRCCNGGCPNRSCLPAGQPCGTTENCLAACCTGGTFGECPGPDCVCAHVGPGVQCASDADCLQGHCVCSTCCAPPGTAVENCQSDPGDCCSGKCADNNTCA